MRTAPHARAAAAVLAACLAHACGGPEHPPEPDAGLLLSLDGGALEVRAADLEPFEAYFEELDPTMGLDYRRRELLDQHLLPLLLARRAFGPRRAELGAAAAALRAVADNSIELRRKGGLAGGFEPEHPLTRNELPMPVAMWAFRPEHLGAVSPPIETARGFVLIAPLELLPGLTPVADRLRAYIVPFETDRAEDFDRWLGAARQQLAGRVDHVDPALRRALPRWLAP